MLRFNFKPFEWGMLSMSGILVGVNGVNIIEASIFGRYAPEQTVPCVYHQVSGKRVPLCSGNLINPACDPACVVQGSKSIRHVITTVNKCNDPNHADCRDIECVRRKYEGSLCQGPYDEDTDVHKGCES